MIDMHNQLVMLGDVMMDAKFAMIICESLPPSYEILKMFTVTMVTDTTQLVSDTLMTHILREEKQKLNQNSTAVLFTKPVRTLGKTTNSIPNPNSNSNSRSNCLKPKRGKPHPHCTNPKCMRIGHTIERCWAEGSGSEGQQPVIPRSSQSENRPSAQDPGNKKEGKVAVLIA